MRLIIAANFYEVTVIHCSLTQIAQICNSIANLCGYAAATDSDIDLIVVSPEFDRRNEAQVNLLWELRAFADPRIEPIACGSRQ